MTGAPAIRHYPDGTVLFKEGDRADGMFIVRSGHVRVFRGRGDSEVTLDVLKPGEFFGEMALFEDSPRSASAQTVGATALEFVSKRELEDRVMDPVVWRLLETLAVRVRDISDQCEDLQTGGGPDLDRTGKPTKIKPSWTL